MSERERIAREIVNSVPKGLLSDAIYPEQQEKIIAAIVTALRDERDRALRRAEALANEHIKNARQTGEHTGSLELLRNRIGELASEGDETMTEHERVAIADITERLIDAAVGMCSCGAKHSDPQWHAPRCVWRTYMDAYNEIVRLRTALRDERARALRQAAEIVETLRTEPPFSAAGMAKRAAESLRAEAEKARP